MGKFIKAAFKVFLILALFLALAEVTQRIRYSIEFDSNYWLFYGFAQRPSDYYEMMKKGTSRKLGIDAAQVENPQISYGEGAGAYVKYNPEFNRWGRINAYGFRGEEFDPGRKEGICRIVALGGSTTFGVDTEDGFTYPDCLEEILNSQEPEPRFEVINAGIAGTDLRQISSLFVNEVAPLKPDIVIVNSVFNNLYYSDMAYRPKLFSLQKINQAMLAKSLLYMTSREKFCLMMNKKIDNIYRLSSSRILSNFLNNNGFWAGLERGFKDIIRAVKGRGIKVVLIKSPVRLSKGGELMLDEAFRPVYEKTYSLLDKIAREEDIALVDAVSGFSENDTFFMDGLHLTHEGNRHLAGLVAKKITEIR